MALNAKLTGPDGPELNAVLGPAFLHARDGVAAYPVGLVRTWPERNRARFVVPLYDQAAIDAATATERERCAKLCETWMHAAERESGPEAAGWLHQMAQHMRSA